jgi:hypothetical protein
MCRNTEGSSLLPKSIQDRVDNVTGSQPLWKKIVFGCASVAAILLLVHAVMHHHQGNTAATISTSSSSSKSPYTKFQPLNFEIWTSGGPGFIEEQDKHGKNVTVANKECQRLNSYGSNMGNIECYLGLDDTHLDVQQRLQIMTDAVERAYEFSDKDSETLKVFVAPEFYFRSRDGAYLYDMSNPGYAAEDDCMEVCQIMTGLETLVAQQRFEDWLFVFGTVVVSELLPKEDEWDYLFYNFAPVYKGYDPAKTDFHGKRFIVPKRYVSNMDFLTPQRHFNNTLAKELIQYGLVQQARDSVVLNPHDYHQKKYDTGMWHQFKNELDDLGYTMIEYDWMVLDGITLSIEVCLDHDMKRALTTYLSDAATGSKTRIPSINTKATGKDGDIQFVPIPRHQAQISIVSSSGMTTNVDSMVLANGGTLILQDGRDGDPAIMEFVQDECETKWMFDGGAEVIQRFGIMTPTEAIFEYKLTTDYKKHMIYKDSWTKQLKSVFTVHEYPPKITVFQPSPIVSVE